MSARSQRLSVLFAGMLAPMILSAQEHVVTPEMLESKPVY